MSKEAKHEIHRCLDCYAYRVRIIDNRYGIFCFANPTNPIYQPNGDIIPKECPLPEWRETSNEPATTTTT
jgi:hypothetical protein